MEIRAQDELLKNITRQNLTEYLEFTGWKNAESPKAAWLVYVGPNDYYGEPLEIVISKRDDTRAAKDFFTTAVDLLSALNQEPPDITIQRIEGVNRDILNVRNIDSTSRVTIPLRLAARQITKLQTLIKQASNSEWNAMPFYPPGRYSNLADRMANEFQFGHTQSRSFGLTVQSPILPKPIEYEQRPLPGIEVEPILPDAPIARRIVERIVRGLIATKNAVKQQSVDLLVESYTSGFNGNMCRAIVEISRNKFPSVEYSVLWSPKISPPEDISTTGPILLDGVDYRYLEIAADEMQNQKPDEPVTITGLVEGLSSDDDPHKLGVGQSIILQWERPDTGRTAKIIVDLKPKEYIQAIEAHEKWLPVEVTGLPKQIGTRWRLFSPTDFRVL